MVDLANAALQAAAAQNVNTTALTFIGAQLTRPDIGELTRRAQAIRGSSLDLKLPDRMLSPSKARCDKALRCVTDASVAHQLRKARTAPRQGCSSARARQRRPGHGERTANCRQTAAMATRCPC